MSTDTSHVRVRALHGVPHDGATEVVCTHCNGNLILVMPILADDFCSVLSAFIDNHEDCEKRD